MRLLVLGGTVFLSKAVAAEAVARGHEVVCACRGASGAVPDGARLVRWDRGAGDPAPVDAIGADVDAVVDVARHPSWVRAGVASYPGAHWVFVSTINVYPDTATPGLTPATSSLHDAVHTDEDVTAGPEVYGAMKVGCEEAVTAGAASSVVVRPGLISGPGDVTSRFGYWPERLAEGGEVLAGGDPADVVQIIDVHDLAAWLVMLAESRRTGVFDGIGPALSIGELLAGVAEGVGSDAALTWVPDAFLAEHEVEPWSGGQGLPLWLPRPEYDGMLARDATPALEAGLVVRPVSDTARETLAWMRDHPEVARTGLSREHERRVLDAWAAR
ncbi:NAD-dependent epimerase/dehydratase family protein [Nocardioides sp.]|uniref:NAD-dependent epimerase/dehydratase family protein n=1 Tax=Nocardioides sp. TaxID=35761 RepID=UPI00272109F4|nr:NAD-dependent epimerase/dehydratase family protein [Nocardioides sp.]MDO9455589.1 epimerase [Nocardioides sp.]